MCLLPFLLALSNVLMCMDFADVLVPGVSYHSTWNREVPPNQSNYGLGVAWSHMTDEHGAFLQTQVGGMLYRDSYNEDAHVAFGLVGFRTKHTISTELMFGVTYWKGSGFDGVYPAFYAGVGHTSQRFAIFIDGTALEGTGVAWLKFQVPIN